MPTIREVLLPEHPCLAEFKPAVGSPALADYLERRGFDRTALLQVCRPPVVGTRHDDRLIRTIGSVPVLDGVRRDNQTAHLASAARPASC